jgi:aspartyl-tRNA(Asn)/glutamyl-tRNA(Gln) amidotransferase subunit A
MPDAPWTNDACSLIDAFRAGELSPLEALDASLDAIERSDLNAFVFLEDPELLREKAKNADVSLPLGGLPMGVKSLESVEGWPNTSESLVFKDKIATHTGTGVARAFAAGAIGVGQTFSSEFGGLNVSNNKLHGVCGNAWDRTKTAGGSSGGSATAVVGGLVPLATGGDGGGSIRIPAAFCGLLGMKGTAGRIPRGPHADIAPLTVVLGVLARSVRDAARYYDVAAGYDKRDPYSLPKHTTWEADLGSYDLKGRKAVIAPTLGNAVVRPEVEALVREAGEALARDVGLQLVEVPVKLPGLGLEWAMSNLTQLKRDLKDLWPDCKDDLTMEIAFGLTLAEQLYNLDMAARVEEQRTEANEAMAAIFDEVDFVICATNPDVACPAEVSVNTRVGDLTVGPENNGALTIPANIVGNPAVSIPVGAVDGLPVGMQVISHHHQDALLFDLALTVERERPWPLVVPGAPV